jgi:predicted nuclease of predicted toxin-antitoxin system
LKFKLDENMPVDLVLLLRTHGHDAMGVAEQGLAGEDDPPVLERAASEDRILMTFDLDFADIRQYRPGTHAGIIVFRLRDQRWKALGKPALRLLENGGLQSLRRGLAVVDEFRIRWKRPRDEKKG